MDRVTLLLRGLLMALAMSTGSQCLANDGVAEVAVGGLVMVKTDAITMQREDLTLSLNWIKVRYEMRNDQNTPVTLHVAFPLPEVPIDTVFGMDIISADGKDRAHMVDWPQFTGPNFLSFIVSIDGRSIEPEVEIRADLPNGRNIVEALRQIGGWWLVLHPRMYLASPSLNSQDADRDIGPAMLHQLRELGAVEGEGDDPIWPLWRTHITFHWMQTFKPGVTIVEHRYRPLSGGFQFRVPSGKNDDWASAEFKKIKGEYCIDETKSKILQEMAGLQPANDPNLIADSLSYIVTTGANWAGPIGTFHLTVDGQYPRVASIVGSNPVRMITLCSEVPLQENGPLRLEGTQQNFTPKSDLKVLMVVQRPPPLHD